MVYRRGNFQKAIDELNSPLRVPTPNSRIMPFSFWAKLYLLTIPIFFVIDIIWIGFIAKNFYWGNMGSILKSSNEINWPAALVFYMLYIAGIIFFAVSPHLSTGTLSNVLLYGALFGFITYATYDLTNLATLKGFPLKVALVDMVWGTVLGGSVASLSFLIGKWLMK